MGRQASAAVTVTDGETVSSEIYVFSFALACYYWLLSIGYVSSMLICNLGSVAVSVSSSLLGDMQEFSW